MRRAALLTGCVVAAALVAAGPASAAPPTVSGVSATNIQGVSALLKGTVNPQSLPTTYYFEYGTSAGFAGATRTAVFSAGSGAVDHPARVAISGLRPATTYHYRLVATNSSGPTSLTGAPFATTQGFGFLGGSSGFAATPIADGGATATAAGSHPYQLSFRVNLRQGGEFEDQPGVPFADGDLRDLSIEMPTGLILNPAVLPQCSTTDFNTPRVSPFAVTRSGESCPDNTQVGTVELRTSLEGGAARSFGVFNIEPAPGVPAQLGFAPFGAPILLDAAVRPGSSGSYAMTLEARDFPQSLDVYGLNLELWGTPWGASHNGERGNCLNEAEPDFPWARCSVGSPANSSFRPLAYVTMPTSCSGPLTFTARAGAWQQPAVVSRDTQSAAMTACSALSFSPRPVGLLTNTSASSPSGFNFQLTNDNANLTDPARLAPSQTKTATVVLPAGVTINPSLGAGLGVCTPAQYAAESASSNQGHVCPNGSKIGRFTLRTPLFTGFFDGAIYLAQPDDPTNGAAGAQNPFDTLLAVYLVGRLPERGVLIKVAGKLVPDPGTGRLTATFDGLPQLPYTDLNVEFRPGQRAPLVTPAACGSAVTQITMTPWSGGAAVGSSTASSIPTGISGGACPPPGAPPFAPDALTGGVNSNVGSYTPYFVRISRKDNEQEITSYSLVLPKGVTGKLAGIPFCPDAAIAAARARQGEAETASPSCPEASQVGRTLTGYGVSNTLTYAPGRIYLAGPYNGAPLSLVTINAATVGPFDLGTIVIRSAFQVDTHTAQLRIDSGASDPIPHILRGIPLHLRDIRIYMDRYQFTHNPSSCEASALVSTITGSGASFATSADDSSVTVSRHFQLLNCLTLGFRPKLGLRLRGPSRRGGYPSLRATFTSRGPQDSNLKRIEVTTPKVLFLAQNHIRTVCTRAQFAAARCPAGSVYGKAVAHTLLFDTPLRGKVYLRSSSGKLPDLVADLYSGAIRIIVEGRIGPGKNGGILTYFDNLPDAPIDRFVMTLNGGKRGLLTNSANICRNPPLATVKGLGQNNIGAIFTSKLRGQCKKKGKKAKKRVRRGHTRARGGGR